jgi:hypothetical protein
LERCKRKGGKTMSNKKGLEPAFPIAYKNYGSFGETEDHECGVSKAV